MQTHMELNSCRGMCSRGKSNVFPWKPTSAHAQVFTLALATLSKNLALLSLKNERLCVLVYEFSKSPDLLYMQYYSYIYTINKNFQNLQTSNFI